MTFYPSVMEAMYRTMIAQENHSLLTHLKDHMLWHNMSPFQEMPIKYMHDYNDGSTIDDRNNMA